MREWQMHRPNRCIILYYVLAVVFTSDMIIPFLPKYGFIRLHQLHPFPTLFESKSFYLLQFCIFSELYYYLLYSFKNPFLAHLNVFSYTEKQHNNKETYRSLTFVFMLVLTV